MVRNSRWGHHSHNASMTSATVWNTLARCITQAMHVKKVIYIYIYIYKHLTAIRMAHSVLLILMEFIWEKKEDNLKNAFTAPSQRTTTVCFLSGWPSCNLHFHLNATILSSTICLKELSKGLYIYKWMRGFDSTEQRPGDFVLPDLCLTDTTVCWKKTTTTDNSCLGDK